jgi:hypothetical protein
MPGKMGLFIAIAFKLCFRICHYEGSSNQEGLKLNGTNHLMVYVEVAGLLGENIIL